MGKKRVDQFYRIKLCPFLPLGRCKKGSKCVFAHSIEQLKTPIPLTKTKMCREWDKCECPHMLMPELCKYAHGHEELRHTATHYKTALCKFFMAGSCPSRDKCRYAHGEAELRKWKLCDTSSESAEGDGSAASHFVPTSGKSTGLGSPSSLKNSATGSIPKFPVYASLINGKWQDSTGCGPLRLSREGSSSCIPPECGSDHRIFSELQDPNAYFRNNVFDKNASLRGYQRTPGGEDHLFPPSLVKKTSADENRSDGNQSLFASVMRHPWVVSPVERLERTSSATVDNRPPQFPDALLPYDGAVGPPPEQSGWNGTSIWDPSCLRETDVGPRKKDKGSICSQGSTSASSDSRKSQGKGWHFGCIPVPSDPVISSGEVTPILTPTYGSHYALLDDPLGASFPNIPPIGCSREKSRRHGNESNVLVDNRFSAPNMSPPQKQRGSRGMGKRHIPQQPIYPDVSPSSLSDVLPSVEAFTSHSIHDESCFPVPVASVWPRHGQHSASLLTPTSQFSCALPMFNSSRSTVDSCCAYDGRRIGKDLPCDKSLSTTGGSDSIGSPNQSRFLCSLTDSVFSDPVAELPPWGIVPSWCS